MNKASTINHFSNCRRLSLSDRRENPPDRPSPANRSRFRQHFRRHNGPTSPTACLAVERFLITGKVSVVIEHDEHGCYAWCQELKGCQSQGKTVEDALANIREAIELFLETLTDEDRSAHQSQA